MGSGSAKFASDRQASSPRIRLELDTSLEIDVVQYFMGVCMVTLNYALCTMALSLHTCGVVCLPKIYSMNFGYMDMISPLAFTVKKA